MIDDLQATIRRDDVDVIGLEPCVGFDLHHRHARACRHNRGQFAAVLRVEMDNDDKGGARFRRNAGEEILQSRYAAGRCPDCDNHRLFVGAVQRRALPRLRLQSP